MINRLFLPISNETLDLVLTESITYDGDELDLSVTKSNRFQCLTLQELASLYLINQLPSLNKPNNLSLEKILHEIINLGHQHESQSKNKFVDEIKGSFFYSSNS